MDGSPELQEAGRHVVVVLVVVLCLLLGVLALGTLGNLEGHLGSTGRLDGRDRTCSFHRYLPYIRQSGPRLLAMGLIGGGHGEGETSDSAMLSVLICKRWAQ